MDTWQVLHGRCEELLAHVEARSVAAVITDPPYGANNGAAKNAGRRGGKWRTFGEEWDRTLPLDWIEDAARTLRPGGAMIVFTDNLALGAVWETMAGVGVRPLATFHWAKPNPAPNPRKNFASAVESGVFGRAPGKVLCWTGGACLPNWMETPRAWAGAGQKLLHPAQKPVALCQRLVRLLVPQGELVLDPFAGSASIGVGALLERRRYLGMDCDVASVEIARQRMRRWEALGWAADRADRVTLDEEGIAPPSAEQLGFDLEVA